MKTYKTKEEARETKANRAITIVEIEHTTEGHCYIGVKANFDIFTKAIEAKGHPEIRSIIAGHDIFEAIQVVHHCDRCGAIVSGAAYQQQEWTRFGNQRVKVTARYCQGCANTMRTIGAGEYTAMEERANETPSYEPTYKED